MSLARSANHAETRPPRKRISRKSTMMFFVAMFVFLLGCRPDIDVAGAYTHN